MRREHITVCDSAKIKGALSRAIGRQAKHLTPAEETSVRRDLDDTARTLIRERDAVAQHGGSFTATKSLKYGSVEFIITVTSQDTWWARIIERIKRVFG